jgi:hypothetical protein
MVAIAILAAITLVLAPAALALAGWWRSRNVPRLAAAPFPWRMCVASALAFVLAFNLQFFLQELFLVVPKALTPGLEPTLFHNNHVWTGDRPVAELFQGTGALATLIAGTICALYIDRLGSNVPRMLLLWLAYGGVIMALAQVVIGAINPQADVGRAMAYLQIPESLRLLAAGMALLLMPAFALWLSRRLPAPQATSIASAPGARHVFAVATLPALIALPLIVLFRVPREFVEVVIVPALFILAGIPWMQAGAAFLAPTPDAARGLSLPGRAIAWLLAATLLLLAIFHLILRPGIEF